MSRKKPAPPLAYSYLRFSNFQQAKGDSQRRQAEARDAWVKRNGAVLDKSLTLEDRGVSGYFGGHTEDADRYALARFLEQVEQGKVPRGSYLLLENLDRLSRQSLRVALTLLLNLIDRGIRVVQLSPTEHVFDENVDPLTLMVAVMELNRGHSESAMKSDRLGKVWRTKKLAAADGTIVTRIVPGWLRVKDGKIVPIPERVKVVRRIFRDVAAGRGIMQIAAALTREGVPVWGKNRTGHWLHSVVHKVVTWRAALGEYEPKRRVFVKSADGRRLVRKRVPDGDPVPGYFPAVVTPAVWQAAQDGLRSRYKRRGKTVAKHWNPFAGWLRDARDGRLVYFKSETNGQDAFVNHDAAKGVPGCEYVSFPAAEFIAGVLSMLKEVKPADVAPATPGCDRVAVLTDRRDRLRARVAALRTELESGDGEVRAAVASLRKLEAQEEEVAAELAAAQAEAPERTAEAWAEARNLIEVLERSPDPEDTEVRIKSAFRRAIEGGRVLIVARCRRPRRDGKGGTQPRHRLAAVQIYFKSGIVRTYLLYYSPAHKRWGVDAFYLAFSLADAIPACDLDLRDPADVKEMVAALADLDLAELTTDDPD